jgi:ketosteroid isomerase-like protein
MPGFKTNPAPLIRHRMAPVLVLIPVLLAVIFAASAPRLYAGMPRTQKHESRREIDQLEEVWRNAVLQANTAAVDSLLADDYLAITPNGTLQTKEQALAAMRSGQVHFTSLELSDRKVRFYGTTALVPSRAEVSGVTPAGDLSGSFLYTRVYVRDERGAWKVVSFEASRIRSPGERK